ncbi:MAG: asparaginase domain-containing protein [Clostridiales bacterium]|nr:asparaginase domain-containing protein [Clostridiales bacterium]
MKILVISAGGTICCKNENQIIKTGEKAYELLLANLKNETAEFSFLNAADIPSENNDGQRISQIVNSVIDNMPGYDGVILLHGTDTLQYTSAALSYACGSGCKSVVIVSADYVLADRRTNGFENFNCAVHFITENRAAGVFVVYKNKNEVCAVHRASRLLCHSDYSSCIYSAAGQIYAKFENGAFVKNKNYAAVPDEAAPFGKIQLSKYSGEIAVVYARPGLKYPKAGENTRCALIRAYHSGTLPSTDESFINFINSLQERQIPCFLSGGSGSVYESSAKFGKMGIIALPAMAFPAQYMKLWLSLSGGRNLPESMPLSVGEDKITNL